MGPLLVWTAVVIGAVFALSAAAKLADAAAAERSVRGFRLVPAGTERTVARSVVAAEVAVPVLLLVPATRPAGFGLGGVLLLVFAAAMVRVLRLGLSTPCACFGASSTSPVSPRHVVRNVVLIAVCVLGLVASAASGPSLAATGLAALAAVPVVLVVRGLDEIADLLTGGPALPRERRQ